MRYTKDKSGYSIIELMVASSILLVGMFMSADYLIKFSRLTEQFKRSEGMQIDFTVSLNLVLKDIRNLSRLDPPEDYESSGDKLYPGFIEVVTPPDAAGCVVSEADPKQRKVALRFTSFGSRHFPEKLLHFWDEPYLDENLPPFRTPKIRLSYHDINPDKKYLFEGGTKNTNELILIDADQLTLQRYGVLNVNVVNDVDPYDNSVKSGEIFNEVTLTAPKLLSGSPRLTRPIRFITNSMAYVSNTSILCVNGDDQVILYNELDSTTKLLLNIKSYGLKTQRFEPLYYAPKLGHLLKSSLFLKFAIDPLVRRCTSAIKLILEVVSDNPSLQDQRPFQITNTIILDNFIPNRPAACN